MTDIDFPQIYQQNQAQYIEEWIKFLSFKSISTDPQYNDDCIACAKWLVEHLNKIGLQAKLLETKTKPVVFAEYKLNSQAQTVAYYGHYDVQPVDPIELWNSDPFTPKQIGNRIFARGAQDNKGQTFYFLKAIETLIKQNALKFNLKLFIEGEEEYGSQGIASAMNNWTDLLKSDVLMICDTGMVPTRNPTVTMGLRGIVTFTLKVFGPNNDLHSGVHGGRVKNPALEMARLLSTLHNNDGSIAVDGFYNGVKEPSAAEIAQASKVNIPIAQIEQLIGVLPEGGETKYPHMVRSGLRPTIEINGIHSGYGGPGSKTIIPAEAIAKISMRLVVGQNPQHCLDSVKKHLINNAPKSLKIEISEEHVGGPAISLDINSKWAAKAMQVLKVDNNLEPVFYWEGASIPIISSLSKIAQAEPLMVGFGLEEDKIHAPNESFDLEQFRLGYLYVARLLSS